MRLRQIRIKDLLKIQFERWASNTLETAALEKLLQCLHNTAHSNGQQYGPQNPDFFSGKVENLFRTLVETRADVAIKY